MGDTRYVENLSRYTIAANRHLRAGMHLRVSPESRAEDKDAMRLVRFTYTRPIIIDGKRSPRGVWAVWNGNAWEEIGRYPESMFEDIRARALADTKARKARHYSDGRRRKFLRCEHVLVWWLERQTGKRNADLSKPRKASAKSHVTKWLLPCLGDVKVEQLDKPKLECRLFAAMRSGGLAPASQANVFKALKSAMRKAHKAGLIDAVTFLSVQLCEFDIGEIRQREARLHPHQVPLVAELLRELLRVKPVTAMLMILMAGHGCRVGESRQARWADFDLDARVWIIPGETTKTKVQHRLTLTEPVIACLLAYREWQGPGTEYLFPGADGDCISGSAAGYLVKVVSRGGWSSHDLRRLARSCWGMLGVQDHVGEGLLNHAKRPLEKAYLQDVSADAPRETLEVWHGAGNERQVGLCLGVLPLETLGEGGRFSAEKR